MSPIVPDFVQSEFQGRKDRQGRKDEDRNRYVLYHRMEHILADFSDDLRIDEIENLSNFTELSVHEIQLIVRKHKK